MPNARKRLVGQILRPKQRPEDVEIVVDESAFLLREKTISTTPFTVTYEDVILVDDDTIGGAATVNLPLVYSGRKVAIKKLGTTGNVLVDGADSQTIDGAAIHTMTAQYESVQIVGSPDEWLII